MRRNATTVGVLGGLAAAIAIGCAAGGEADRPVSVVEAAWPAGGASGRELQTTHYAICTTVPASEPLAAMLAPLMEGAWRQYAAVAGMPTGPAARVDGPLPCYVFATRAEWSIYTRQHTGALAPTYLRIGRGAYTAGTTFVAYDLDPEGTCSAAAHEGWHQFVAANFKSRLPPFLEEGIACLFEQVAWSGQRPTWDLSVNGAQSAALADAIDAGSLYSLDELSRTHAGMVVGRSAGRIAAFYAQSWAFVRFLREADGGRYRSAFQAMLTDARFGQLRDDHAGRSAGWDPASARPLVESYLGQSLDAVEFAYTRFCTAIIAKERPSAAGQG